MKVGDAKSALRLSAVCCAVLTGLFTSEVLSALPSPTIAFEMPLTVPVKVGDSNGAFKSRAVCCAVETGLAVSDVLSALPSPTIALEIPPTVPVKVGDSKLALRLKAVCCAVLTGLFTSDVLSALPRPTIAAVTPLTVPVKVGLLMGAFKPIWFDTVVAKLASDPIANASSFKVSNAAGALATKLLISVLTNSVVAS